MSPFWKVCLGLTLTACIVMVVSCVTGPAVQPIRADHAAAMHAVHSERIAALMKSISRSHAQVRSHRGPLVQARKRSYNAIEAHATDIVSFSDELRGIPDGENFSAHDRGVFLAYVETLRERADELRAAAKSRDKVGVQRSFARLTATCNSCHYAFRESIQAHREREQSGPASGG